MKARRTTAAAVALHILSAGCEHRPTTPEPAAGPSAPVAASPSDAPTPSIEEFCAACHRFPPPAALPRASWKPMIESMYEMMGQTKDRPPPSAPPIAQVVRYYEERAPERLAPSLSTVQLGPGRLSLEPYPLKLAGLEPFPGTANVHFARLFDDSGIDLLLCDMRFGAVFALQPRRSLSQIRLVGRVPHPCHAEVVDLDQDGARDLLVADLGTVTPSDATNGAVVWLQRKPTGDFHSVPIATELGRVADAQAADFDGDGDLDIVAAVFGWRKVGEILYLENRSAPGAGPRFEPYTIDARPGAIHVPVVDLDRDGRPDFVALISQHFEAVVAYHNVGPGRFEPHEIYAAEHPAWGSSGIELVDLDGDADLDILCTNGDTLDDLVLKPYHGVGWLENQGRYPFTAHRITSLQGAHAARAADLDGDGDLDVAVSVFIPFAKTGMPGVELADSIIWLERNASGGYDRHSLEGASCIHPTLDCADVDGDGDIDIAVGNMTMAKAPGDSIESWGILFKNRAKP
jgi:hypothetical protein